MMYQVCKRIIGRGNYPEDIKIRIEAFREANLINEKEYNELIALLGN